MPATRLSYVVVATVVLATAVPATIGCQKVVQEIDKPGPAPPYNPKGARIDPNLLPDKSPDDTAPKDAGPVVSESDEPADEKR